MKKLQKCALSLVVLSLLGLVSCNENKDNNVDVSVNDTHAMINGDAATEQIYDGIVSIYSTKSQRSVCTGTLIHPEYVLTSASCFVEESGAGLKPRYDDGDLIIALGTNPRELSKDTGKFGEYKSTFKSHYAIETIYRENYRRNDFGILENDIALVKLAEPIDFVPPIPPLTTDHAISRDMLYTIYESDDGTDVIETDQTFRYLGFGMDEAGNIGYKLINDHDIAVEHSSYCGMVDGDSMLGCIYGMVNVKGCHPDKEWCELPEYAEYCETGKLCVDRSERIMLPFGSFYFEGNNGHGLGCDGDVGGPALVASDWEDFDNVYVAGVESYSDIACAKYSVYTSVQDFYDSFILKVAPEIESYWDGVACEEGDYYVNVDDVEGGKLYRCQSGLYEESECFEGDSYHTTTLLDSHTASMYFKCINGSLNTTCPEGRIYADYGIVEGGMYCAPIPECEDGQVLAEMDNNSTCINGRWVTCEPGEILESTSNTNSCHIPDESCDEGQIRNSRGKCIWDSENHKDYWMTCPEGTVAEYRGGMFYCWEPGECENDGQILVKADGSNAICDITFDLRGTTTLKWFDCPEGSYANEKKNCVYGADNAACPPGTYLENEICIYESIPESKCGNGKIDEGEVCDGQVLGNRTCASEIGVGSVGQLNCNETCDGFDTTMCTASTKCGNGKIDEGEVCDGQLLGNHTCESEVGPGSEGQLYCNVRCDGFNTSMCSAPSTP